MSFVPLPFPNITPNVWHCHSSLAFQWEKEYTTTFWWYCWALAHCPILTFLGGDCWCRLTLWKDGSSDSDLVGDPICRLMFLGQGQDDFVASLTPKIFLLCPSDNTPTSFLSLCDPFLDIAFLMPHSQASCPCSSSPRVCLTRGGDLCPYTTFLHCIPHLSHS